MRRFLQQLLTKPTLWLAKKISSNPDIDRVHQALSKLFEAIMNGDTKKGPVLPLDMQASRYIIFSDQHKGAKDGSDDFRNAETNYISALQHYHKKGFHLIALGDCEELWENLIWSVMSKNKPSEEAERLFVKEQRFTKVYGNHDLFWNNDPFASLYLKSMYGESIPVYEGVVLQTKLEGKNTNLFLTHGHQGDGQSDGNPLSAWFVSRVWAPFQSFLNINPNTPAYQKEMKSTHNRFMYEWSRLENNPVLITGHTHQPVFASLTHLERLYKQLISAEKENNVATIQQLKQAIQFRKQEYDYVAANYMQMKPFYFNTGCCCFSDGDITGIEIADGMIRLIKWKQQQATSQWEVLEEMSLENLLLFNGD
ncbi:metallophosphoesterase family protein [Lacibacter sp. MH-610]|uniref:metallophosphoesterase n=1 Tax=Lacibacter sp. MH-610 TaxID=3020883 RepID=UPI003892087A